MYEKLQEKTDLFVRNFNILKKEIKQENIYMLATAALAYTERDCTAQPQRLKECADIIKRQAERASAFRGSHKTLLMTYMSFQDNPENYLEEVKRIHKDLAEGKIIENGFALPAALILMENARPEYMETYVRKTKAIFERLNEPKQILPQDADLAMAALLAVSEIDPEPVIHDAKENSELLKKFADNNERHLLSLILALSGAAPKDKCEKVRQIFDQLKQEKHRYGRNYELLMLGTLALTDLPAQEIASQIIFSDDRMKTEKEADSVQIRSEKLAGSLGRDDGMRRMIAASLVLDVNKEHISAIEATGDVQISSIVNIIQTQTLMAVYICMSMAIMAAIM